MDKTLSAEVSARFDTLPRASRERLMQLRDLVARAADADPRIGPISEELKWAQPSYLPKQTKSGTTVRLWVSGKDERPAIFVPCSTSIVDWARERYEGEMEFEGDRAIIPTQATSDESLRHVIAHALTYKLR